MKMDMSINSIHYFGRPVAIATAATALATDDDDDDDDNDNKVLNEQKCYSNLCFFAKEQK